MKIGKFIFLLLALIFALNANSQTKDEKRLSILKSIYSCNFDSADLKISSYVSAYPKEPQGYFLSVLSDWWKINLDRKNVSLDEKLEEKVNKTVDLCDELLDKNSKDVDALIYKGASLGYKGLTKSLRENWLSAADDGRQALNLLDEALELAPKNKEALLGIGIYNYFAEYIPDRYQFLKPLMIIFPKGDKLRGVAQIKDASENSRLAMYEAKYIIAYFNLQYERNFVESELYSKNLFEEFPTNPVFEKMLYNCYSGFGKFTEALDGWTKVRNKNISKERGFEYEAVLREADYYISLSLLKLNRLEEMEQYINECENISNKIDNEDTSFKVFAVLMQGMRNDAVGNRGKAVDYYKKVLDMKEFAGSQNEANRFLKTPYQGK
ncbi:MAG: tetratricopeptide repeat protein [Ignavibacteria bacterium]